MPSPNIRASGLKQHYEAWRQEHPDAIPWERFEYYLRNGDEFGRPVPLSLLADRAKTTKNTMFKWVTVYDEEQPGRRKK